MSRGLKGAAELDAFLAELPRNLVSKVMRGAGLAGAGVVRDEARLRVRRKSGKTAKAIKTSVRVVDGQVIAKVKLRGDHSFVGYLLEYGVAPHIISAAPDAVSGKATSVRSLNREAKRGSLVIGGNFVGSVVFHPGFSAAPFLRPALDAKAAEAINAMGVYIQRRLTFGALQAPALSAESEDFAG